MRVRLILAVVAAVVFLVPVPWSLVAEEFFSAAFVGFSPADVIRSIAKDRHPPLYFLVLDAVGMVRSSDAALRSASGMAALGSVLLTAAVARRLHAPSPDSGLTAGLLVATSPLVFVFAHFARSYAFLLFFGALLLYFSLAYRGRPAAALLGLGMGGAGCLYTHYAGGLLVVAALGASAASAVSGPGEERRFRLRGALLAALLIALLFAPWAWGPLRDQLAGNQPSGARSAWVLLYLFWSPDDAIRPASFAVAALLCAGGLGMIGRRFLPGLVWLLVAIVGPLLLSAAEPARLARNYVGFLPFFAVAGSGLLLDGLGRLRLPSWLAPILVLGVQLPILIEAWRMPFHPQDTGGGHDYAYEAALLDDIVPVGDRIDFRPTYLRIEYERYAPRLSGRLDAEGPSWSLTAVGRPVGPCPMLHLFRVRVDPPAERCESLAAALDRAAAQSDYPHLHLELAVRHFEAKDLAAAAAELETVLRLPQRHPAGWELAGKVADARDQPEVSREAWTSALRIARAYEMPGRRIGGIWDRLGRLEKRAGEADAAARSAAAANCARTRTPAWACGGPLEFLTRGEPDGEEDREE